MTVKNLLDLSGKVALVTGASRGLGLQIATGLAEMGARLAICSRKAADLEAVAGQFRSAGIEAFVAPCDLANPQSIADCAKTVLAHYGQVDILVNNAGVYKFHPLDEVTEDEFHRQFNTNVLGLILATKEAAKYFNGGGGSVINVGSVASRVTPPQSVVYTATKGAVDAVTGVLARELGTKGIRVNSINPGLVQTEGTHSAGIIGSDFETRTIAETPLARSGHPDDIAPVAVFLASDDSRWVTGETLLASGGMR